MPSSSKKRKPADAVVGNVARLRAEVRSLEKQVRALEKFSKVLLSNQNVIVSKVGL